MKKIVLKNLLSEKENFKRQLWRFILIMLIPLACIMIRLIDLQLLDYKKFATMSVKNLLSIEPLPPARGLIYDRNHVLLAANKLSYRLNIIPERAHHLANTILTLKNIIPLSTDDIHDFYMRLRERRPYQTVPLAFDLTKKQVAQIYVTQYRLPGVVISTDLQRQYPLGESMAPIIGYVGRINQRELQHLPENEYRATNYVGKAGIEKYDEAKLHGHVGAVEIETDVHGHTVKSLQTIDAEAGENLTLSVDSKLQQIAMQALQHLHGAAVVISAKTGEVLALASQPSFAPNPLVKGLSEKNYKKIFSSGKQTMFNKAVQGLYSAASTTKPFLAVGALDMGVIHPKDQIYDPGWFKIDNTKHIFHDWALNGHGWVNVSRALMVSCDTFFYHLAVKLGVHRLTNILKAFGFGTKTGIDLPNEKSGVVPSPAWKKATLGSPWYEGDTVETAIGQEYILVTPLQLALAAAKLAEHGKNLTPHLLIKVNNRTIESDATPQTTKTDGKAADARATDTLNINDINTSSWNIVRSAMVGVIKNPVGTGLHFGRDAPYSVAGKTGTAQVFGHQRNEESNQNNLPEKLRNNHLFIAYAPVKNPQIAVAVVIEHDRQAAEIARKLMDFYFLNEHHLYSKVHKKSKIGQKDEK